MTKKVCVIAGVGPGNGASFARKFTAEGYAVALLARNLEFSQALASELPDARAFACDVADQGQVEAVYKAIHDEMGVVETLVYNASMGAFSDIEATDADRFLRSWQVTAFGGFLAAKQVIEPMKTAGGGNIIFIGATASIRGGANFAAFASAKAALRSLAQSISRSHSAHGIHTSHIVVDGMIDGERARSMVPDKPDDFFMNPDDIAESVYFLSQQPKSAWTFELDMRPFGEQW